MSLFSGVESVRFEGADSDNEFAFRVYDRNRMVLNKRMEDFMLTPEELSLIESKLNRKGKK